MRTAHTARLPAYAHSAYGGLNTFHSFMMIHREGVECVIKPTRKNRPPIKWVTIIR